MRLPYWNATRAPRDVDLVRSIEQRRGGALLNLDRALLWSEPLARSWNGFLGTLRQGLSLDAKLRELAICVVARTTGATYEFHHHAPVFLREGGTEAQLSLLINPQVALSSGEFSPTERAVIEFAATSTRSVAVPDEIFDSLKTRLSEQDLVELVAIIAAYNMVARFLVALRIEPESDSAPASPGSIGPSAP